MGVGIDIGSKTIKIVDLVKDGNLWKLKSCAAVGFAGNPPQSARDDKELADLSVLVKKLHKDANISKKEVAIALPEPLIFTRIIKFPPLSDQEIASAVKWEAEQYIPIPLTDAIVQHQITERKEGVNGAAEVSVLLIAAPKTVVEKYVKVIQLAGLSPILVETELISIVRSLAPKDKTTLIVDMGSASTNIAIAKNGQLVFARSVGTAGDALTRSIAQSLGMAYEQAEQYKRAYGLSTTQLEGKIRASMLPILQLIIDEVKKAIHFYQTEERGEAPSSTILSGGSSGIPELITFFGSELGSEVVMANPFANVSMDPAVAKTVATYASIYSISTGLAMGD